MSVTGLMNQSLTVYSKSGYDKYGRETVGTGTSVACRFQKTTKQRLALNGALTTIVGIVYVPADTTVAIEDKITFDAVNYRVFGIYAAVDGAGNDNHLKLELTKWL